MVGRARPSAPRMDSGPGRLRWQDFTSKERTPDKKHLTWLDGSIWRAWPKPQSRDETMVQPLLLLCHMTDTAKTEPRPLFTPSTLPQASAPDPVVLAIEAALRSEERRVGKEGR